VEGRKDTEKKKEGETDRRVRNQGGRAVDEKRKRSVMVYFGKSGLDVRNSGTHQASREI